MIELRDWIRSTSFEPRPWLVLGKGPTFSRRDEFPLGDYNLMGLNDVAGELDVDVAHVIDVDVVKRIGDRLSDRCRYLLMPRRPHVEWMATERTLEDFLDEVPVLRELDSQGRLVWYNARTSAPVGDSPVIPVRHFSSEAAIDILGEMGVRQVRSLGIDGGGDYGGEFDQGSRLANGLPSFDAQFRQIEDIVAERGIDYDPLIEPMRVFVGVDESQIVAARVLEHTIRKHASRPVRFYPMMDVPTPEPKDPENRGRTGFSFSRFHIPKLAGYKGRALYVDADMQVFGDIAELWDIPFGKHKVLCTRQDEPPPAWKDSSWFHPGRQMSVMLLDCERLDWDIERIIGGLDAGEYNYSDLLFDLCIVDEEEIGDTLPPVWNHLEQYQPGETKLTHYTVVPTQPWKNEENPLCEVWEKDFHEALEAQIVTKPEVKRLVRGGHVKPSLAGKAPQKLPMKVLNRLIARGERALLKADKKQRVLRRPAVLRLRSRLGLL
jgi:hypothetical protein